MNNKKKSVLDAKERIAQLCREKKERLETERIAAESKINKEREKLNKICNTLRIVTDCVSYSHVDSISEYWIKHLLRDNNIKTEQNTVIALADLIYTIVASPIHLVVELGPAQDGPANAQECRSIRFFGTTLPAIPISLCLSMVAQCIICNLSSPSYKLFDHIVVANNVASRYTLDQFKYDAQIDEVLDRKSIIEHIIFKIINGSLCAPEASTDHSEPSTPTLMGALTTIEVVLGKCLTKFYTTFQASQLLYKIDESKLDIPRQRAKIIYDAIVSIRKFARQCMSNPDQEVVFVTEAFDDTADFLYANFCKETNSKMDHTRSF